MRTSTIISVACVVLLLAAGSVLAYVMYSCYNPTMTCPDGTSMQYDSGGNATGCCK